MSVACQLGNPKNELIVQRYHLLETEPLRVCLTEVWSVNNGVACFFVGGVGA